MSQPVPALGSLGTAWAPLGLTGTGWDLLGPARTSWGPARVPWEPAVPGKCWAHILASTITDVLNAALRGGQVPRALNTKRG